MYVEEGEIERELGEATPSSPMLVVFSLPHTEVKWRKQEASCLESYDGVRWRISEWNERRNNQKCIGNEENWNDQEWGDRTGEKQFKR